jgi:hypothetical protein
MAIPEASDRKVAGRLVSPVALPFGRAKRSDNHVSRCRLRRAAERTLLACHERSSPGSPARMAGRRCTLFQEILQTWLGRPFGP